MGFLKQMKKPYMLFLAIFGVFLYFLGITFGQCFLPNYSLFFTLVYYFVLFLIIVLLLVFFEIRIVKYLGYPINCYLFMSKSFSGMEYFIYLNNIGILREKGKNSIRILKNFKYYFYDLINQLDMKKVKDGAVFYVETWVLTKKELLLLDKLDGVTIKKRKRNTIEMNLICFFLTGRRPKKLKNRTFYVFTFEKQVINDLVKNNRFGR